MVTAGQKAVCIIIHSSEYGTREGEGNEEKRGQGEDDEKHGEDRAVRGEK